MNAWWLVGLMVWSLFVWVGGFCYGWLMGERDAERRWSDTVKRVEPPAHVKGCVSHDCHAAGRECPACV